MRILLDNCVHKQVAQFFSGHEVITARKMGWQELSNGKLLAAAAKEFDVFVTTDKNIRFQQNLPNLPIAVIELQSSDGRIEGLRKLLPSISKALELTRQNLFVAIQEDGTCEALAPHP